MQRSVTATPGWNTRCYTEHALVILEENRSRLELREDGRRFRLVRKGGRLTAICRGPWVA
jgi:hypothetical protein